MTLASVVSHFQANSLGQPTKSADPHSAAITPPFSNEWKRHQQASRRSPAWFVATSPCIFSPPDRFWCVRGGWFHSQVVTMGRTDLPTASLHLRPQATSLLPPHCSTSSQPSVGVWYFHYSHHTPDYEELEFLSDSSCRFFKNMILISFHNKNTLFI